MWLLGTTYNFCRPHRSLRQHLGLHTAPARRWSDRTPAQAAGLTDHPWSIHDLLIFPVPGLGINKRGALPKSLRAATHAA